MSLPKSIDIAYGGKLSGESMNHLTQERMLKYFSFDHLPENLQNTSMKFFLLACEIIMSIPQNPERTVALRKLLESKDCAVRAMLED